MDQIPPTPTPPAGGEDRPSPLEPGFPVGRGASDIPRPADQLGSGPAGSRTPSWVVPMLVLALIAGLGIGMAVGLLVGGRGGSGEAAPITTTTVAPATTSTTAAPTTTAPWNTSDAYGAPISVDGDALPALRDGQADTAIGLMIPEITGTDFAGNTVSITANGRAKMIVALAHWCPYCNDELPIVRDWYAAGIPGDVEVISLHVYSDPSRPHFPPADWLRENQWNVPLIADDESRTLVAALGIPAVPFWLVVGADGKVLERATGLVQATVLDTIAAALDAESAGGTTVP